MPLSPVFDNYSKRINKGKKQLRYFKDSERLCDKDCPSDVNLQDGDIILVYEQQVGGW